MSSSLWSNITDRSSSSLSWEEECDEQAQNYLQNLIESIDGIVFSGEQIPDHFSDELAQECLIWKNKFSQKFHSVKEKVSDKKSSKLKSLSAPKMTEPVNIKDGSSVRSLSEQRFSSSKTRLNSIPYKSNDSKTTEFGSDKQLMQNQKPLILPPIVNTNIIKRDDKQINNKQNISKVPNINKTRTSFPKPAPVLSLEHILNRSQSSLIEENGTNIPIVLHLNNYHKFQPKDSHKSRKSVLPFITSKK